MVEESPSNPEASAPFPCPVCRKPNPLSAPEESGCLRCGAPLRRLRAVIRGAQDHQRLGTAALWKEQWTSSIEHAQQSWSLQHSSAAALLGLAAALGQQDSSAISLWTNRVISTDPRHDRRSG